MPYVLNVYYIYTTCTYGTQLVFIAENQYPHNLLSIYSRSFSSSP